VHEALGREALAAGGGLSAAGHLTRAALCYHFGKFMFVHDPAQMKAAHLKTVECRNLALPTSTRRANA
jgi:2,6-dihydroxypseudooxynicotine hydrolase